MSSRSWRDWQTPQLEGLAPPGVGGRGPSARPNFHMEFCSSHSGPCPYDLKLLRVSKFATILISIVVCTILIDSPLCLAQSSSSPALPEKFLPEKVIIDTDIGDDIDDAFAIALALRSPELQILGITTTFGDTETRAKLLDRFLAEAGRPEIPLAAGASSPPNPTHTQPRYPVR